MKAPEFEIIKPLKIDAFSKTDLALYEGEQVIVRTLDQSNFAANAIARWLAKRERNILRRLNGLNSDHLPKLLYSDRNTLIRSYMDGVPLVDAGKQTSRFYEIALEVISKMHALGVIHNDLEKPENWIVLKNGEPGIIDFQLAMHMSGQKNYFFKRLSFEDVRHTLKNKKRYCVDKLTEEEAILKNRRSALNKFWRYGFKPVYNFVTRKIFNYSDRASSQYSN